MDDDLGVWKTKPARTGELLLCSTLATSAWSLTFPKSRDQGRNSVTNPLRGMHKALDFMLSTIHECTHRTKSGTWFPSGSGWRAWTE